MAKSAGLALLLKLGKKKPSSDSGMGGGDMDPDSDGDMHSSDSMGADDMDTGSMPGGAEDEKTSIATSDLADSLGVPEDKRADFADAFKSAVKACMSSKSY